MDWLIDLLLDGAEASGKDVEILRSGGGSYEIRIDDETILIQGK